MVSAGRLGEASGRPASPSHSSGLILKASFLHLSGISEHRERELWRHRVLTWAALRRRIATGSSPVRGWSADDISKALQDCHNALAKRDVAFFASRFPRREHYRLALAFPRETVFLDIETTGLSLYYDHITLVGWSVADQYGLYLRGESTDRLREALARAKVIVTFNGSRFDLPFLRQEFPDLALPAAHVDLCFLARRVDLGGPQKEIERRLRLRRDGDIADLDGRAAPLLWHEYRRGDVGALRRLIQYNHADIEGMKDILDVVVRRLLLSRRAPRTIWPSYRFAHLRSSLRWSADRSRKAKGRISLPRFRGDRPSVSLASLAGGWPALRIVGIDLTGSEKRASGWCQLIGREAETRLLHSDDDLIRATLDVRPDVISIDSPLSLPRGRTRVTDDDPGRDSFGIMRTCERVLRRRGLNVYPCLIPSMQRLTERGIRLATTLREQGLPTVESYPGAAQDILGIPRKRASVALLREGLSDFGIRGEWLSREVTHDELDSLTAALVGVFFWAGRFEGLGDRDEGQLVVPDLRTDPTPWLSRRVVGFSGPIGAGKTSAARFLEERGYAYGRFSQVLEEILRSRGASVSRDALQTLGEQIHRSPGQRWLCQQLVASLPKMGNIVIDGLRHPEDHACLVEEYGPAFVHVHIDAPEAVRRIRYVERRGSAEELVEATAHPVERNVGRLADLAHTRVMNTGSLEDLKGVVLHFVSAFLMR
ncbi:MAG: hypothetical protein A3I00_06485 [Betaproteobacteria bacterium RIFCSPLOWO2_02_FULL_64_12]|nr:MAG: hypothetical protein A3I00_06485 [Betaproteobacteria bacterium RIFCSPLOWO2_02_FULL_64_12]